MKAGEIYGEVTLIEDGSNFAKRSKRGRCGNQSFGDRRVKCMIYTVDYMKNHVKG